MIIGNNSPIPYLKPIFTKNSWNQKPGQGEKPAAPASRSRPARWIRSRCHAPWHPLAHDGMATNGPCPKNTDEI